MHSVIWACITCNCSTASSGTRGGSRFNILAIIKERRSFWFWFIYATATTINFVIIFEVLLNISLCVAYKMLRSSVPKLQGSCKQILVFCCYCCVAVVVVVMLVIIILTVQINFKDVVTDLNEMKYKLIHLHILV